MGLNGRVLGPRYIGPGKSRTQIPFIDDDDDDADDDDDDLLNNIKIITGDFFLFCVC